MKRFSYIPLTTILILLFLSSCKPSEDRLKKGWWKFGGGHHIGDAIDFNNRNHIKKDTIFYKDKPLAVIKSLMNNRLQIKAIENGEVGYYHNK